MKYAHLIKLTVFSYEYENNEAVLAAFLKLLPFNLENNNIILKKTEAKGFNDKKIKIIEVVLTKNNLINFFLRFDKDSWINDQKLIVTDSGRCYHLKISIAAFPKKNDVALALIRDMIYLKNEKA